MTFKAKMIFAICLALAVLFTSGAWALEVTPAAGRMASTQAIDKSLSVGESVILDFRGVTRAVIGDPAIADIVVLSTAQLLINGKAPGATLLYVWDKAGRWNYQLSVTKAPSRLAAMLAKINAEIALPAVKAVEVNGVLVLEGTAASAAESARAEAIAGIYSKEVKNLIQVQPAAAAPAKPKVTQQEVQAAIGPGYKVRAIGADAFGIEGIAGTIPEEGMGGTTANVGKAIDEIAQALGVKIVWLPTPATARQITLHAKVVDVDKSALKDLGLDWGRNERESSTGGDIKFTFTPGEILLGESLSGAAEHAVNDGGPIRRLQFFGARLQALVTQNKARVLSEPKLLVKEGERAKIHVGGEIPVLVPQTSGTGQTVFTVQWKEYGVILEFEGRIMGDGKSVDLMVNPQVSDLDFANAIPVSGSIVPAMRTRKARTRVQVQNGQTLVIGGLLRSEEIRELRKVPLLGDIPLLGELFKSRSNTKRETELMIFVTPEVVSSDASGAGQ